MSRRRSEPARLLEALQEIPDRDAISFTRTRVFALNLFQCHPDQFCIHCSVVQGILRMSYLEIPTESTVILGVGTLVIPCVSTTGLAAIPPFE